MTVTTEEPQRELFAAPPRDEQEAVVVNDRVTVRTQGGQRVVVVAGLPVHHYAVGDRAAEAYAMLNVVEAGFADQNDVARAFGCSTRTLRRSEARFDEGGIEALGRPVGRPKGAETRRQHGGRRDRVVRGMKAEGFNNCEIARRLGISEAAVRKRLKRSGWVAPDLQRELFESEAPPEAPPAVDVVAPSEPASAKPNVTVDPLDRSGDRLCARLGLLDDAAPVFAPAASVPRAGVLLAIPGVVESGVVDAARAVYGERALAPAFYGLRTTVVAFVLLALLRIKRPEALKEHAPPDLGRILGLDRVFEVKTLRRKLALLASQGGAEQFGRDLARRRVAQRGRMLGFLYVDGHVRVYHGKHKIPKAHVAQLRLCAPATTDYYVNDKLGDPLLVVTAEANAGMVKMLLALAPDIRAFVGKRRRPTIVFDRGGWSPKLFVQLLALDFDVLTYRKGRIEQVPKNLFRWHRARIEGREIAYRLHDKRVHLLNGQLRLRQVTRLCADGHQTTILTSRFDLKAAKVAYRMFERWRQENFFKYMRDEFEIDALAEHAVEPDDPARTVPNPARRDLDTQLKAARAEETKLAQKYGRAALDNPEAKRPTARGFKIAHGKTGKAFRKATERVDELRRQRAALPERVPVGEALGGKPVVKLAAQRKHLTTVLKMVAYQIESDLLALLRDDYARVEDEGRTLVQTALQSAAALAPAVRRLGVIVAPLSSPHRSRAIATICEVLNAGAPRFPGTDRVLHYNVASAPSPKVEADTFRDG